MGGEKRFLPQVIKVNEKIRLKAKIGSPIYILGNQDLYQVHATHECTNSNVCYTFGDAYGCDGGVAEREIVNVRHSAGDRNDEGIAHVLSDVYGIVGDFVFEFPVKLFCQFLDRRNLFLTRRNLFLTRRKRVRSYFFGLRDRNGICRGKNGFILFL